MKKLVALTLMFAVAFAGCKKSDDDDNNNPQKVGIVGEWYSAGQDVAPLLVALMGVDSIYAKFESNNTYLVESYNGQGVKTEFRGTYVQAKSGVGEIWNITLNQTTPSAVTSVGIFEISTATNPYTMQYEVVQTEPNIGATPPTAQAGFGSTNGGALLQMNVQKYKKINR